MQRFQHKRGFIINRCTNEQAALTAREATVLPPISHYWQPLPNTLASMAVCAAADCICRPAETMEENIINELKPSIHDEANGLDYVLAGDYYLPAIELPEDNDRPVGKWGRMRRQELAKAPESFPIWADLSGALFSLHLRRHWPFDLQPSQKF